MFHAGRASVICSVRHASRFVRPSGRQGDGASMSVQYICSVSHHFVRVPWCLITYLWWKSLNGYLEHRFTQQHLVLLIIMSSSTPRSAAQLRRSARVGTRAPRALSGSKARSQSPGPQGRGATADGDEAATASDEEQPGGGDAAGAAGATACARSLGESRVPRE